MHDIWLPLHVPKWICFSFSFRFDSKIKRRWRRRPKQKQNKSAWKTFFSCFFFFDCNFEKSAKSIVNDALRFFHVRHARTHREKRCHEFKVNLNKSKYKNITRNSVWLSIVCRLETSKSKMNFDFPIVDDWFSNIFELQNILRRILIDFRFDFEFVFAARSAKKWKF